MIHDKRYADFFSLLFKKRIRIRRPKNIYFLPVSLIVVKSEPLSETRLTDQQYRKNQSLFPQTFAEHFIYKTHLILASFMNRSRKIGQGRYITGPS